MSGLWSWRRLALLGWVLAAPACSPSIDLSDDKADEDEDADEDDDTEAETDTGPDDPCDVPETEPNAPDTAANTLPLESTGCGEFDTQTDFDFWSFTVPEEAWLEVRVDAWQLGSLANVQLLLNESDGDAVAALASYLDTPDVLLVFPADPGDFVASVSQAVGPGLSAGEGERFFYELIGTVTKPPLFQDTNELESGTTDPNDDDDSAQLAMSEVGETLLFGDFDKASDRDWYQIDIPAGAGSVELTVDTEAHEYGSAANVQLVLYDSTGTELASEGEGVAAYDPDAIVTYTSTEAETVFLEVIENGNSSGAAYWYFLRLQLEG